MLIIIAMFCVRFMLLTSMLPRSRSKWFTNVMARSRRVMLVCTGMPI